MISRIRVEARAASMEEAEREIHLFIQHANVAAQLEGLIAGGGGRYTDSHFGPVMNYDAVDAWTELGLGYEGRLVLQFEPAVVRGGLKGYGYTVLENPDGTFTRDMPSRVDGVDVTDKVMVLNRQVEVTRDSIVSEPGDPPTFVSPPKEPSRENLARIIVLAESEHVTQFGFSARPPGWGVDISLHVALGEAAMAQVTSFYGATLDEALTQAEEAAEAFVIEARSS